MWVLVVDLLFEKIFNFFKVGKCVNIGDFIFFRVIVYLVVVEFVIAPDHGADSFEKGLAFDEQIS